MSLPCLQGVLYVPQEVQDCHLLVLVTSEVSDTPVSQPLTAVMQSLAHGTSVHSPQTTIVLKW